jgi:hypothetical protein
MDEILDVDFDKYYSVGQPLPLLIQDHKYRAPYNKEIPIFKSQTTNCNLVFVIGDLW